MESSGGAEKSKKYMYTCSGEEKEKNVESNYTFSCHAMKIKVLQGSVLNDFSKNGWAFWEVHSPLAPPMEKLISLDMARLRSCMKADFG